MVTAMARAARILETIALAIAGSFAGSLFGACVLGLYIFNA